MKFEKQLSSLITAALLCGTFTTLSSAQQTAGSGMVASALRQPQCLHHAAVGDGCGPA